MSLLPRRWMPVRMSRAALAAALVAPFPLAASGPGRDDPCALQYKAPSYDRRLFAELGSGFRVPQDRPFPYVVTPRVVLLRPLDAKYRWSLSGSVAARFGDRESSGTLGARLHRSIASGTGTIRPGLAIGLGPDLVLAHHGGLEAAAEITVDLTPLMIGARGSWGPITLNHDAFSRPARLETFIGWRILGWRRESTPLGSGPSTASGKTRNFPKSRGPLLVRDGAGGRGISPPQGRGPGIGITVFPTPRLR